jgi:predicted outer membrane lipoprotein
MKKTLLLCAFAVVPAIFANSSDAVKTAKQECKKEGKSGKDLKKCVEEKVKK